VEAEGAATFRVGGDAYDRHVGRYGAALARGLIARAGVEPGQRALDVGCGPGALSRALADVLGEENVAAVDPSEPFVEACRARVPGADVRLGAAEALPFDDGRFDAALSQLVVNFMTDPEAGVREMGRVTRPGGTVASVVWDYAGEMTLLRTFWDAACAVDPGRAEALEEGRVMQHCREGELRDLWLAAGLRDVATGAIVVSAAYESFDDLWSPFATGLGPSGAYFASLDDSTQQALLTEWRLRLGSPAGPFSLTARAWYAAGAVRGLIGV
jgi:SAM-dependent methyltransferase